MPRLRSLGHRRAVLALSRPSNTGDKLRSGARAHAVNRRGHSAAPPSAAPLAARGLVPPKASSASSPCSTAALRSQYVGASMPHRRQIVRPIHDTLSALATLRAWHGASLSRPARMAAPLDRQLAR